MKKKKFDFKSINFKLWLHFTLFAVLIVLMIWLLQIFFLKHYYEEMKTNETTKFANKIRHEYNLKQHDPDALRDSILNISIANDLTIFIRKENHQPVTDSNGEPVDQNYIYSNNLDDAMLRLYRKLQNGKFDSTTEMSIAHGNSRTLEYACYLGIQDSNKVPAKPPEKRYIMYIFTPLYPVSSTVSILRSQLIYISVIALLLALALSIYLSQKISRPIVRITDAAEKMGAGDYQVTFPTGHFTEITELADTLTLAEFEIQKAEEYQQDLIANVSHDLRTPLTMIKSYAEMIRDLSGDNPVKRQDHLNVIIEESDRLNALVNDMLNLSRMQSGKISLNRTIFDINKTATSVMKKYHILNEQENYNIIFVKANGSAMVNADEAKIKQIMENLMSNAIKYCGEDRVIVASTIKIGKKIRFSVKDNGMGIDPEELPHVWDKYYKTSTNHVRPTDGTGLGLSIVKKLLTLHHAKFDVISKPGKGSTFYFELPLIKTDKTRVIQVKNPIPYR